MQEKYNLDLESIQNAPIPKNMDYLVQMKTSILKEEQALKEL
jgi:hypothetical protein